MNCNVNGSAGVDPRVRSWALEAWAMLYGSKHVPLSVTAPSSSHAPRSSRLAAEVSRLLENTQSAPLIPVDGSDTTRQYIRQMAQPLPPLQGGDKDPRGVVVRVGDLYLMHGTFPLHELQDAMRESAGNQ
eukprot:gnl/Dysnectes_brevis/6453_a10022_562.p2 GENE.gnl/Dysnectes_brevis/6453_a10022_562~~gnl/Dysnectes_brevis/6453_a10022_562.p2  ORF type:complete len:130 (-),score=36.01 gnl/Dysnectes_brevis/6453_a10022_562:38-427(-)